MKRKTNEEFVYEMSIKNPDVQVIGKYINSSTKIRVRGKECNHEWESRPQDLLRGHGCPECKALNSAQRNRKDILQFSVEMKKINPNILLVGEYKNNKTPIRVKCKICEHEWAARPDSLIQGHGCPKCAGNIKLTEREFKNRLNIINSNIKVIGKYVDSKNKVHVRCINCGFEWNPTAYSLLNGRGCPQCAGLKKKCTEEFIEELGRQNSTINVLGEYQNNRTKLLVQCKNCGNRWKASPKTLLRGQGCPLCNKAGTSFVEQLLLNAFKNVLGDESVLSRDCKTIGYEIDIYIPEKHIAFEPGSWYWHKSLVKRDYEKRRLCNNKGIRLITIYDSFPADGRLPFEEDCYTFERSLNEAGYGNLKELLKRLFELADVDFTITEKWWDKLVDSAHKSMQQMNHLEFVQRLSVISPTLTIMSSYSNLQGKIQVKCDICGYVWETSPSSLLKGAGCVSCLGVKKYTTEEFKAKLHNINPNLLVFGNYVNGRTKLKVKDISCGHEWMGKPESLLKGAGCPECAGNRRKTQKEFVYELKNKNPNLTVLGKYINAHTKVEVQCNQCKRIFEVKPNQLLSSGTGCKYCNIRNAVGTRNGKTRRKTTIEYTRELKKVNTNIEVIGEYKTSKDHIKVKCRICGYVWSPQAGSLLRGTGCPNKRKHRLSR